MSCEKWHERIVDHLGDELTEREAVRLQQHIAECIGCAAEERRLRGLFHAAVPPERDWTYPELEQRLLGGLRDGRSTIPAERSYRGGSSRSGRTRLFLSLLGRPIPSYVAIALVLAALFSGLWLGNWGGPRLQGRRSTEPARDLPRITTPFEDRGAGHLAGREGSWTDSVMAVAGSSRLARFLTDFTTTPSDAFSLAGAIYPDTL